MSYKPRTVRAIRTSSTAAAFNRVAQAFLLFAALWVPPLVAGAQLPDFTELVEKQGATVVNISTTQTVRSPLGSQQAPQLQEDDPFYEFFRRFVPNPGPREFQNNSLGSGFIISTDGFILTNAHVVEAADEINVKLNDKREFKAKVIGSDKRTDIALIKIEPNGPLPLDQLPDGFVAIQAFGSREAPHVCRQNPLLATPHGPSIPSMEPQARRRSTARLCLTPSM